MIQFKTEKVQVVKPEKKAVFVLKCTETTVYSWYEQEKRSTLHKTDTSSPFKNVSVHLVTLEDRNKVAENLRFRFPSYFLS